MLTQHPLIIPFAPFAQVMPCCNTGCDSCCFLAGGTHHAQDNKSTATNDAVPDAAAAAATYQAAHPALLRCL